MLPNVNVFIRSFILNIFYVFYHMLNLCIYVYVYTCKYVLEGRMVD